MSHPSFKVVSSTSLAELQSTMTELIHEASGAKVLHIGNEDPENLFCLSFQTLPASSNGVAHILEHTVLCGSRKFPIKDPFFSMTRRSLNTFMNAFTGQDFTCYPASSQVEKDFYNLLEVYLDAVFFPELKKMSFLQEGHRLEWSDQNSFEKSLLYKGVVYNEMKGAMTSPDARLSRTMSRYLTPDLPYAHNSGGEPKEIPSLSYEELLDFHRTFYHPSRCLFFFYGNFPLSKHLDFLQKHVLGQTKKLSPLAPIGLQPRFQKPVRVIDHYPAKEGCQIAFGWLTARIDQQEDLLALCLIEAILMDTDASPLKMALLKSGLCKEAESSIDVEMSEVPLVIVCKGCDPLEEKKLQKLLFQTLKDLSQKPLDPDLIEGALHQLEFQRTEIAGEGWPFGLTLFMKAGLIKQHGRSPEDALLIHSCFTALRKKLQDSLYLPHLMGKYLVENPHFVTLVLIADPNLEKKEEEEEKSVLEAIRQRLSKKEKEEIASQAKSLLQYQEAVEHQSIDCLPKVTLQDVPLKSRDFPLEKSKVAHLSLYHHSCFTNHITYADLVFDLPHIEPKDLPLLSLLSRLWTELGSGGRSYEETLQLMQGVTGGIDAHLALHVMTDHRDHLKPAFSLRGKALDRNVAHFFNLLSDFAKGPDFNDEKRIRQWLLQHATELENDLVKNSMGYATQLALSPFSIPSTIYNQWNGLAYHRYVQKLSKEKSNAWMQELARLAKLVVSAGPPDLVLSCSKSQRELIEKNHLYDLGEWKAPSIASSWKGDYPRDNHSSHVEIIPSPVAFTVMGRRTSAYSDPGVAELMISTELLENVVLHREIREKGGAYGSGASYSPTTGNYHLSAYRDPNLSQTISVFGQAIDQIASGSFSERELEEAKLSLIAAMDTPVTPGGRAIVAYAWHRSKRTLEDRQQLREEILSSTKSKVTNIIQEKLQPLSSVIISLLGEELWKKEEAKSTLTN